MAPKLTPEEASSVAHWSTYGQPGCPTSKRVQSTDWRTSDFKNPTAFPWSVNISSSQLPLLLNGFRPGSMDDKWFIYADGPDQEDKACVHFYRSWTGTKVAEVWMRVHGDGKEKSESEARITGLVWELIEDSDRSELEKEGKEIVREVCRWVLDVELPPDEVQ